MKKVYGVIISFVLGISFVGCEDVFEENITGSIVLTVSPKNDETITGNSVDFLWNNLDEVTDYRVQILKEDSGAILIDSLVSGSTLTSPMNSVSYGWRVRGENFASQTAYSFSESFRVESTNDLLTHTIFLNTPSEQI